jgi:putative IMPACT (imprinted ancient) family translation regulator
MLDVLRHQGLEGALATVVRYYGGVKLGAGGLVRAYTDCVAQALKSAEKIPRIAQTVLACAVPYAQEGLLRREIERAGAQLLRVQHGSAVSFEVRLPAAQALDWQTEIGELTQGRAVWS